MSRDKIDAVEQPRVLIVDDVPANLGILRDALEPEGYNILGASNGKAALKIAAGALPDLILLDIVMPGMDGYEVCRQLKQNPRTGHIPVIFVTMRDDKESILQGFRVGGVDYITKSCDKEEVLLRVKTHLELKLLTEMLAQKNEELEQQATELTLANQQLQQTNERLTQEIAKREQAEAAQQQAEYAFQKADEHLSLISRQEAKRWGIESFVGKSKTISKILEEVRKLQHVERTSVLITGESGTGKELIARAIHFGGSKAKGQFISVNCSAIPSELAESTFFGHVRGAFSGAKDSHKGNFELADGGTLFLDEIGDMPLLLQPKLLRVIEDGCVMPVGGTREKHVDVRLLAATNQNLKSKIAQGDFRDDLYFRLARYTVTVPPLREHKEDIPLLAEHFLKMFAAEMGIRQPALSPEALSALENYHLPGNVRELKNIIEHALIKSGGSVIQQEHLNFIVLDDISVAPRDTGSGVITQTDKASQKPGVQSAEKEADFEYRKALVIKRARKPEEGSGETKKETMPSPITNEEKLLQYVEEHGSINNAECRDLLSVDLHHASYLLKKLHEYGVLAREGERRWTRYRLP